MIVSQAFARSQPLFAPADIEDIKDSSDLVEIVSRHTPLKKKGRAHWGPCPFHNERTPSFKVDPANFYHCFGCGAHGDAIDILTKLEGLDFAAAIARLKDGVGPLTPEVRERLAREREARRVAEEQDQRRKIEAARTLWKAKPTVPIAGTLGEKYFRITRAITLDPLPPSLRFHPELPYYIEGEDGEPIETGRYPAILAAVQAPDRSIVAVHRTYLQPDGLGKAPVEKPKKLLGSMYLGSHYVGGAVRLAAAGETLGAGEGLESCASVLQETGMPTWAGLGTAGLAGMILPPLPLAESVVICADNDANGAGLRAAQVLAERCLAEGRKPRIAMPPEGDFNDMLRQGMSASGVIACRL